MIPFLFKSKKAQKDTPKSNPATDEANTTQSEKRERNDERTNGVANIYNLIIVDESGSMGSLTNATLSGVNETINTIRSAAQTYSSTQRHYLTLVTFDESSSRPAIRTLINRKPIEKVGDFRDYCPYGSTPLYDAIGESLTELNQRISEDKDAIGVVTILTDGLENASNKWNAGSVKKLIEQLSERGWSFSYMGAGHDVKSIADLLSIGNYIEFSHDEVGTRNTWAYERSAKRNLYREMDIMYCQEASMDEDSFRERRRSISRSYYSPRVTPNRINQLNENEIFVFGSNIDGMHTGGASALAVKNFGAIMGQGEGLQGNSYAIPTTDGLATMQNAINRFICFAEQHPELHFFVTAIGCGVAGYSPREIAPLFESCIRLENVSLPEEFWNTLGLSNFCMA